MKKVNVMICVAMMMIFCAGFFAPRSAEAATKYVNDASTANGVYTTAVGSDANAGTAGAPYRTITKAISMVSAGDTIYIDAGTYAETVNITKNGISLIGADSTLTVINVLNLGSIPKAIFAVPQTQLKIKKLGIINATYGIFFINVDISFIDNVNIVNNISSPIYFENCDSNSITNCSFDTSFSWGVRFYSSKSNIVNNNVFNHMGSSHTNGVEAFGLYSSDSNIINYNKFMNTDIYAGLWLLSSNYCVVRNNLSTGNSNGIWISSGSNNLIDSNILNNNSLGIAISSVASRNYVTNNVCTGNDNGINILSDSNVIENNIVSNNYGYGLLSNGILIQSQGSIFRNNVCSNNGQGSQPLILLSAAGR